VAGWHLRVARRVLRAGGVVAYPTEAVYGLGCDPFDAAAIARLLAMKGRAADKGLILVAADFAQIAALVEEPDGTVRARLQASWPGFVTWVLPARVHVPRWLTGRHRGLAVRVTAHPVAAELCRQFGGPLVSTSANPTGRRPARDALTVRRYFGSTLDYLVGGRVGGAASPSEIRDALTGELLRA